VTQSGVWYAIQIRPRAEKLVARLLEEKGYQQFLPLYAAVRKWSDRVKKLEVPLFPGYLFCRIGTGTTGLVSTTPGVIRIVGAAGQPTPVEESEILAIRRIVTSRLHVEPWTSLREGQVVQIISGPLEGLRGTLCRIGGRARLVVSVSAVHRSIAVDIDGNAVVALPAT
jgi:transcription antitermination factor NusG